MSEDDVATPVPAMELPDSSAPPSNQPSNQASELTRLSDEIAELRDLFRRKLLEDRQRQQMYDELYRQLEFARKGMADEYLAPIARELLLVVDRIDALPDNAELGSVRTELTEVLARRGVREVDATGEKFDPRVHEAVGRRPASPTEVGLVVEVRRPGYALGERLLRPAQVVVGYPAE